LFMGLKCSENVLINIIYNSNDICVILLHYTILFILNRHQCVYFELINLD